MDTYTDEEWKQMENIYRLKVCIDWDMGCGTCSKCLCYRIGASEEFRKKCVKEALEKYGEK